METGKAATYEVRISGLTELQARTLARIRRTKGVVTEIWMDVPRDRLFARVFDSDCTDLVDPKFKDWW